MPSTPFVALSPGASLPFIGTNQTLTLSFSNTGGSPGYAPFLIVALPPGADGYDGTSLISATYLGAALTPQMVTFDGAGHATNPITGQIINGTPGSAAAILALPFGSFSPGQTAADVQLTLAVSNLADNNTPMIVSAVGGFAFGNDPLNNPGIDPPFTGAAATASITPVIATLAKTYLGPEQETATGPSYTRQWDVVGHIAPGQTLSNYSITDTLPNGVVIGSAFTAALSTNLPATISVLAGPGGTTIITATFTNPVTGADAPTLHIPFWVNQAGTGGGPILGALNGAFHTLENHANYSGNWVPIDPLDTPVPVSGAIDTTDTVTAKSIAEQKSVAVLGGGLAVPGATLDYTLKGQVSDYFDLGNLTLTDTLGDGQTFDAGFTPTITLTENGATTTAALLASEYTVGAKIAGVTTITIDVSEATLRLGFGATLAGTGEVTPHAATATVNFRATVDPLWSGPVPGDPMVDQGDVLTNSIIFGGTTPSAAPVQDNSGTSIQLPVNTVSKAIVAINGVAVPPGSVTISAGDDVTYHLRLDMPLTHTHLVSLQDFLPLPVFLAADPDANGVNNGFTWTAVIDGTIPLVNNAKLGPFTTVPLVDIPTPTITANPGSNSLIFDFGTIDDGYVPRTLDLLFTVRVRDAAFGDGLLLTNQVTSNEANSQLAPFQSNAIVQFVLGEPLLTITKGVVSDNGPGTLTGAAGPVAFAAPGLAGPAFAGTINSTNLAATPVDANLRHADAGDLVKFAIIVDNQGHAPRGAYDVLIHDVLPAGFAVPGGLGTNIQVTNGAGAALAYTVVGGGLFDPAGGIRLDDAPTQGAIAADDPTNGTDIVVITYDLQLVDGIAAGSVLTNTASIVNYTAVEGSLVNRVPTDGLPDSDPAFVDVEAPLPDKTLVLTSEASTTGSKLAIGETATWLVTVTVPEGISHNLTIRDIMPGGLGSASGRLVELLSVGPVTSGGSLAGPGLAVPPVISNSNLDPYNDTVTLALGDVTNLPDGVANAGDQISFLVIGLLRNDAANAAGQTGFNRAVVTVDDPNSPGATITNAINRGFSVVEPHLSLTKDVDDTTPVAGQTITYTLVLKNDATGGGAASAFDAVLADTLATLAPNVIFNAGSVTAVNSGGYGAGIVTGNGGGDTAINVTAPRLDAGQTLTVQFTAHIDPTVPAGNTITNTATASFTSLPGASPNERSYSGSDPATITLPLPGTTKALVASSDANTTGSNLAIGEVATFRLTIDVPDGTNNNLIVTDHLPDTLLSGTSALSMFPMLGSVQVISVGGHLTGITNPPVVSYSDTNGNGVLDAITMNFGNVVNAPADLLTDASDRIVVEFQAIVSASNVNAAGDSQSNSAFTTSNGLQGNTALAPVTLVEPKLDITKSTPFISGDAGDQATYTVTIHQNAASTAAAYNVTVTDLLPPGVVLVPGSAATTAGSVTAVGNLITLTVPTFLLGAPDITLTYAATLADSVFNGQVIPNTANLTYASQPTGIRTYTGSANDSIAVAITDTVEKQQVATSLAATIGDDLAVGETVTYRLFGKLGEGSQHLILSDALPTALTYMSSQVTALGSITGSALAVGAAGTFNGPGNSVSFDFGTITNPGNNVANSGDWVVVEVTARLNGTAVPGSNITDTMTLAATTPGGAAMPTLQDTHINHVVAPLLTITKATPFTVGDAGDVATYTIIITHAAGSTAAAYNVTLGDLIQPGLVLLPGASTTAGTLTTPGGNSLALSLAEYDLGSAPITITYQAKLADGVINGQTIPNTAILDYATAPTNGVALHAQASDSVAAALSDTLVKTVFATSFPTTAGNNVGIGEIVTYRLTTTLSEGAQHLVVTDAMPAGLQYLSSQVLSLGNLTGSALGLGAAGSFNGGTNTVGFDFGDVINPGDNLLNAGDRVVLEVRARVLPGANPGDLLTNTGISAPLLPSVTPFAGTPMAPSVSTQTLTVVPVSSVNGTVGLDALFFCCGTQATAVFAGVTVNLLDGLGNIINTTTTDAFGHYTLTASIGGTYAVQFVSPSGLVFAPLGSPGLQGVVSDADPTTGITAPFVVTPAPVNDIDAGLLYFPTVGLTGNAPTYLPNGGGTYNFNSSGIYAIGGTGGGYTLNANGGLPYLVGGTGNNILHGGNGQGSILVGGPGQNIFEGTPGADIILFCCGGGNGQGLGSNGQGLGVSGGLFNGNACFNFDLMVGGLNADTIEGNDGNTAALGGGGNDSIHARGLIVGGTNAGTITSLGGGNFGNYAVGDIIKIGNGPTQVVYQVGDGVQYVENFNPGRGDHIDIFGYGAPVATGTVNGMGVLYFGPNSALVINGWQPANGPLNGINYYAGLNSMPGAFGHFNPLPPVVLPTTQTSFYGTQGDDIAIGSAIGTIFTGNGGNDLLVGGNAADIFFGGAGNDSFYGGGGSDQFNLGPGSDYANGCDGNDVAILNLNQAQATIIHNADGTVTVITPTGAHVLDGVEYLRFNDATVNLTGGALPPLLLGTPGPDSFVVTDPGTIILDSWDGDNDQAFVSVNGWAVSPHVEIARLIGAATSVTGNATGTQLVANPGLASTLISGGGPTVFWGGAGADTMLGGVADDIFRPGAGLAQMSGGLGNDQYVITNPGQIVVEAPGQGIDTVWVTVNGYQMAANVEIGRLQATATTLLGNDTGGDLVANPTLGSTITGGNAATTFWGGTGADVFTGGNGDDIFRSGSGVTAMTGGLGNDQYVVNNVADVVIEAANGGIDTEWFNVSGATLAPNVEIGRLAGSATMLTGAATANQLVANPTAGSTLVAGAGTTALWGSGFADTFFSSAANQQMYLYGGADIVKFAASPWGVDEIADFSGGWGDGDKLNFQGSGLAFADLTITDFGTKTLVQHGADQIILYGVGSLTHVLAGADLIF
jgi:uncharacterized repeat protein (TIGR01451 family)/fimbrial isopeptide formation D2 family protein